MRAMVFDTETTGLILNRTVRRQMWPEVVEFACIVCDLDTGEEFESHEVIIRPTGKMEKKAAEATGFTDQFLAENGVPFSEAAERIERLIEGSDVAVAHNASFDQEVIDMEFDRLRKVVSWPRLICTVEQTMGLKGRRINLGELHEHLFGMKHEDAHRAMTDVKALRRIAKELRRLEVI